jgi:hypothetical protein
MPTRIGYTTALGAGFLNGTNPSITATVDTGYSPRGLSYFDATGTQQLIFTLSKKIYRYPGNTDISRAAAYTNGYFSFAQYRDKIYGVNGADLLQKSTTGAFADVASTPKLTRIAVNGEYMAGINLVANYTLASAAVVAASAYRLMISAVGNPEQFDYSVDTTAFTQDIVNTGGPLTALATLRDMFVVFQKSGVYVVESTGNPADPWAIRLVSDYYGCEWPDSVIEVNNVLYWISPTRSGEVCAFDGAQITVLSQALQSTIVDQSTAYSTSGFVGTSTNGLKGGITSATDGETIVWSRFTVEDAGDSIGTAALPGATTKQLYLNIATGRFGYSDLLTGGVQMPYGVFSNAWQNGILTVVRQPIAAADFKAAKMSPFELSVPWVEWYRRSDFFVSISNLTVDFSEWLTDTIGKIAVNGSISATMDLYPVAATDLLPAYFTNPTLQWLSSKTTGNAISKTESTAITVPSSAWNSTTNAFDIGSSTVRSKSARVFAFKLKVQPLNSLVALKVSYAPSGSAQAGAKAGAWQ